MFLQQKIVGAIIGAVMFLTIIYLLRSRRLNEARAALWLISGALIFGISVSATLQMLLGRLVGSTNRPATLVAVGVLFVFTICLDLAVQVTSLNRRLHNQLQDFALLEELVRRKLEKS